MDIDIYTDGACSGNPGTGGWGFIIIQKDADKELFKANGGESSTTNNRMELSAVIEALKKLKTLELDGTLSQKSDAKPAVQIYTDSQYVMKGIQEWILNWKKNNWQTAAKKSVKNQDLWQELDALNCEIAPNWNWVKGHSGNRYNEECDRLAVQACKKF